MSFKLIEARISEKGITYSEYFKNFEDKIKNVDSEALENKQKRLYEYRKLNFQRCQRIHKTYQMSDELKAELQKFDNPQLWMVISEDWCGDSAQLLPYIAEIAKMSNKIDLRILYRDENADIMEKYLTNGTRSIPKLIAFDDTGNEVFRWGPRPQEAAELFKEGRENGLPKSEIITKLHAWYSKDRGISIEKEFLNILKSIHQEVL
ncbi:thioredoxin family protein [Candidatus Saccharibacteria bacterium]|nr:thioredoxin family protein [Candidatus Saccharibacteria bacterium]NIV99670.1 thioredoxin family protein [Candidatus Saccharibacteria bacterium]NIW79072.1 thioredoxin family protein [Calditrichia bacterium]